MATRAERLQAICERLHPPFAESPGNWGPNGSPYVIDTAPTGQHRIRLTHPITGDTLGAVGATMDEAVDNLAKRVEGFVAQGV